MLSDKIWFVGYYPTNVNFVGCCPTKFFARCYPTKVDFAGYCPTKVEFVGYCARSILLDASLWPPLFVHTALQF